MATTRKATRSMGAKKMATTAGERGGFTIIEVVLVLAIAGLIFLMVFIALPALQRSQRDTQRRESMSAITDAITNYQTNNNGRLPADGQVGSGEEGTPGASMSGWCTNSTSGGSTGVTNNGPTHMPAGTVSSTTALTNNSSAACLIKNYLNSVNATENTFTDPLGSTWGIQISTLTNGNSFSPNVDDYNAHMSFVIKHAKCDGENAVYSANARDYVVMARFEGSGVYCQGNGS